MGESATAVSFGDIEGRSRRYAHLLRAAGLRPGDHVAILMENHERYFEVFWGAQRIGLSTTPINWHLKADEAGYIIEDCGAIAVVTSARAGRRGASQLEPYLGNVSSAPDGRRHGAGLSSYEAAIAEHPADPLGDEVEGSWMFYSSGTTGRPKGIVPRKTSEPFGSTGGTLVPLMAGMYGFTRGLGLPVPRAALPRGAVRLVDDRAAPRGDRRRDGALRRRADPAADRAPPGHARPVRADPLRPHAQAARRGASPLRPVEPADRHPRRRAVSRRRQAPDDRLVGADHPRVLRGQRGQRLLRHRTRGVAGPSRLGRSPADRSRAHRGRGRRRTPGGRGGPDLVRVRARVSSTTTTRRRRRARTTTGAGARSATSATSTTTATCT